ncbi:hypothetical protein FHV99_001669 [Ochrobactrum sp. P20RRXII]|nr:hypothetical protein [Ochrobactrum sp. P20RRXII]
MEVGGEAVGAMQAYLRLKRYILPSGIAREELQAALPFLPSAARELALEEAVRAIDKTITDRGVQVCCGNGERSIDGHPECCGQPEVVINAGDVLAAIRALSSAVHAAAGKVEGDGWLPIESAPKDKMLLLACANWAPVEKLGREVPIKVGYHSFGRWTVFGASWTPTHWRPLPSAPSQEVAGS